MLERSLLELVGGQCFSSPKLAKSLLEFLRSQGKPQPLDALDTLRSQCKDALFQDMEQDRPRQFRRDDLRQLIERLTSGLFVKGDLPLLDKLSKHLLVSNGDYIHYRDTEVQAYARLAVDIDPGLLAAWHLSGWLQAQPSPDAASIRRRLDHQTPFFAPLPNHALPYAEGHVHLGGVSAAGLILGGQLLGMLDGTKNERQLLLRLQRIVGVLLEIPSDQMTDKLQRVCQDDPDLSGTQPPTPDWRLLTKHHAQARAGTSAWVLGELAQRAQDDTQLTHCWLWLLVFLFSRYRDHHTTPAERVAILYVLVESMQLRHQLIMDNLGLSRFTQDYFANKLRKTPKSRNSLAGNLKHLLASPQDLLEAKGSPGFFSADRLAPLARELGHTLGMPMPEVPDIPGGPAKPPSQAEWRYLRALEQWQFCAHFSRSALGKKNGRQHTPDMAKLWSHAENLHQNMQRTGDWNRPEFLGGRLNPHFQFEPFRWLRGLDVAGNENDLPIEWFAPMLRWLRQPIPNPCTLHQPRSGFHFSIHAGEDYAHPLSGLRHVDETVRFCQMRDGDRLGHALALGIKPKRWIAQHGDVLLPVDEHLDNLVWAWHHATLLSRRLPLAMQVLPALERRIQRMLPYGAWLHTRPFDAYTSRPTPQECICRPHERLTPELLHEAWQLRRNCRYTFTRLGTTPALSAKEQIAVPDLQRLQRSLRSEDKWSAEAQYLRRQQGLALGHASPYLVLVRAQHADDCHPELDHLPEDTQETVIHDSDSPEELRFMHALQDYLLHEYDRKGLIIETNPTSNVYIGRIGKHKNHPIFRWNPPDESLLAPGAKYNRYGLRRGPIRVLVNTDDPGIMPTTLRTEFALLREAAIERGIARTVAEDWLERLRRYGVEQFHRNHLPVFTPTHAPE